MAVQMSKDGGHLTVQYNLRWSEEMRDKIATVAKENTRSMNQEIIARLEESFEPEIKVAETLEFNLMMQSYMDQKKELEDMKNMLQELLEKTNRS